MQATRGMGGFRGAAGRAAPRPMGTEETVYNVRMAPNSPEEEAF